MTWPVALSAAPVAAFSNNPRVEPVPCPISGASAKKRSDFFQNSSLYSDRGRNIFRLVELIVSEEGIRCLLQLR